MTPKAAKPRRTTTTRRWLRSPAPLAIRIGRWSCKETVDVFEGKEGA